MDLPDAGTKLRTVLDYVPCEACLADPVQDQELLCTICARLDRQVAIRVGVRRTVIVEHPSPAPEPVVIAPAAPPEVSAPVEPEPPVPVPRPEVHTRFADGPDAPAGSIDVIVEPLPAPEPAALIVPLAAEPEPAAEEEPEFNIDDIASFVPAFEEFFDYKMTREPAAPAPEPDPIEEIVEETPVVMEEDEPAAEDDFVFRPPPVEEEPAPEPEPEPPAPLDEDLIPEEEVPVVSPEREAQWAPPPDFLAEEEEEAERVEAPAPVVEDEEIQETEVAEEPLSVVEETIQETEVAEEPVPEEEILETEVLEAEVVEETPPAELPVEEVMEMEVIEDEPEPTPPAPTPVVATGTGDLYRLRGFDAPSEVALGELGIHEIGHLSGHDAQDLAGRAGVPFEKILPWIQAADLYHEVGVPIDAANALVAAGIAGPRGLAEADADEAASRASSEGGHTVTAREVRRWKRRA